MRPKPMYLSLSVSIFKRYYIRLQNARSEYNRGALPYGVRLKGGFLLVEQAVRQTNPALLQGSFVFVMVEAARNYTLSRLLLYGFTGCFGRKVAFVR